MPENSRKKIVIISPHYPPMLSGLADHSAQLKKTLESDFDVFVICHKQSQASTHVFNIIDGASSNWNNVEEKILSLTPDYVWFQYVPYMYSSRGIDGNFIKLLKSIRQKSETKVVTMWHELFMQLNWPPHYMVYKLIQKLILRKLLKESDISFTNCQFYEKYLQRKTNSKISLLPVGSNIDFPRPVKNKIKDEVIRLALFGSDHVSKKNDLVYSSLTEIILNKNIENISIYLIGQELPDEFKILKKYVKTQGRKSAKEVSSILMEMDYQISFFSDGLTTRRGSAMAALASGTSLISTVGPRTEWSLKMCPEIHLLPPHRFHFTQLLERLLTNKPHYNPNEISSYYDRNYSWKSQMATITKALNE